MSEGNLAPSRVPVEPARVSVVLAVHNVARFIEGCVEAVAHQTLRPFEVIVVDDCGTDGSVALAVSALQRRGLPHSLVAHEANRGVGAARNTGLAAARGDFVWFLDCDDRAEPSFLESLMNALAATGADLAVCRTLLVTPDDQPIAIDEPEWASPVLEGRAAAKALLCNSIRAYAGNKLFRRELLPPRMFDEGRAYEDFRPLLVHLLSCDQVALVNDPLLRYRQNPGSTSGRFAAHTTDMFAVAADVRAVLHRDRPLEWDDAYLEYLYLNAVLPVANLALRAEHAGNASAGTYAAIRMSRQQIRAAHVARLARLGRYRLASSAAVLKLAPRSYSRVLARR